ncbi:unnamed protein product [Gongylonema pulchrum]|uniref:Fibronectin type-III domain-containing protein n=1 Tax=Gongylonema pulchrum TaxID=637853 RepID=A0A183EN32_9BILA|nr:unnamed protein product [Gongylonema pulchrum]
MMPTQYGHHSMHVCWNASDANISERIVTVTPAQCRLEDTVYFVLFCFLCVNLYDHVRRKTKRRLLFPF